MSHRQCSRRDGPARAGGLARSATGGLVRTAVGGLAGLLVVVALVAPAGEAFTAPTGSALASESWSGSRDTSGDCHSRGPWYTDLAGHWAEAYIRVLWYEGVTTRPLPAQPGQTDDAWTRAGTYRPDTRVGPSVFGTMLIRVFPGEPFVPPPVAYRLAEASDLALAAMGLSGAGAFGAPEPGFSRIDAVCALIEALGLTDFADTLDPEVAKNYLKQFSDWGRVSRSKRQEMAIAILLGIIRGYPDRTIQPERLMTRAEAATVVYRSCLLLAEADPNPFSPDGDGAEDTTLIALGSLLNRNARGWDLTILDSSGRVLRHLRPRDAGPAPPAGVVWAGETDSGVVLAPGTYYYQGWLRDRDGRVFLSALKPIVLEAKSLVGFAHPALVLPGETVFLFATAAGEPVRVTASLSALPGAGAIGLRPRGSGSRQWEARFEIPSDAGPGTCRVSFLATFASGTRSAQTSFEVGRFTVSGGLEPNPIRAGKPLRVTARPNLAADSCVAELLLPGGEVRLSLVREGIVAGRETWGASCVIPPGIPVGSYPVRIEAGLGASRAEDILELGVTSPGGDLTYILSD